MDIKLTPPKPAGTIEERLASLERWAKKITSELNLALDEISEKEIKNGNTEK